MTKVLRKIILKPLLKARAKRLAPRIHNSTKDCATILDIGCGDMVLTNHLVQKYKRNVTAVDTIDSNLTHLPVKLYDGETLPFESKSFDATLAVFMLHHCPNIENVLQEIIRVTKKKIIILDEVYQGGFSKKILQFHDMGNVFYSSKMAIPLNFKNLAGWHDLFTDLKLNQPQYSRIYQYPFLNLTHQVYFEIGLPGIAA